MRKLFAAIALMGLALLTFAPAAHATGDNNPDKVWVCKYVGAPGDYETLKEGKQPIQVDDAATGGNDYVGADFADGQFHSYVIDLVTAENTDQHNDYIGEATCPTSVSASTTTTTEVSTTSSTTTEPTTTSTVPDTTSTTTTQPPETTTESPSTTVSVPPTTVPPSTSQPTTTTTASLPPSSSTTTSSTPSTTVASSTSRPSTTGGPTVPPVTPPADLPFTGGAPTWLLGLGLGLFALGVSLLLVSAVRRDA